MTQPPPHPRRSRRWPAIGSVVVLIASVGLVFWLVRKPDAPKSDPLGATEANARGVGLMEQFEYAPAAKEFEEAVRLAPEWLPARINLGMALYNAAASAEDPVLPKAIAIFEQVLKDEPDNLYAHFNLGIIFKYQAKYDLAQKHFRFVTDADPDDDRAWLYQGQAHIDSQVSEECRRYFQKALALNPYLVPAWYALANHASTSEKEQTEKLERMKQLQAANWEDEARPDRHSEQGRYATIIGRGLVKPADIGPMPMFEQQSTWNADATVKWTEPDDPLLKAIRARFGGVMIRFDFDGDDKPDLLLLSAATRHGKVCDVLLRNMGTGFVDVSEAAGLGDHGSFACAVGDYDNDGRPDLALSTTAGLRLLRNVDGKRFEDKSAVSGFDKVTGLFLSLTWLDIDQDGDLDLIAGRYSDQAPKPGFNGLEDLGGTGKVVVLQNVGVAPPSKLNEPLGPLTTTAFKPIDLPNLNVAGRVTGIVATDIDGDKDVDLIVLLEWQAPVVVLNDRLMRFSRGGALPTDAKDLHSGLVFDANGDEQSDLLLLSAGKPAFLDRKSVV